MFKLDYRMFCREVFKQNKICSVAFLFILKQLTYMQENKRHLVMWSGVYSYNNGKNTILTTEKYYQTKYEKYPVFIGRSIQNKLPSSIKTLSQLPKK